MRTKPKGVPPVPELDGGAGPVVGRVVSVSGGEVTVTWGRGGARAVARVSAAIDDAALALAARDGQDALLVFDRSGAQPVLLALLRSTTPMVDAVLAAASPADRTVARVDGRRVVIEGKEEVVLRCGKATLTLRADGKVTLRGVDVVSQADRVQKVRGGKVQIN